ncbi:MAG: peptidoglycan DD-metalloendopeptidase family protein [Candidatus Accumulibacter sp.]|jgi:murein DD-endopeptidase MepM/ murein hydrolase activator NlpD|nr:peptidoglycan DD-metalloendopeptidase family protein [Accumulibacter sp.]
MYGRFLDFAFKDERFRRLFTFFGSAFKNPLRHPWLLGGVGGVALLGMVTASAIVSRTNAASVPEPVHTVLEQVVPPAIVPMDSGADGFVREERIQRSDTLSSLFSRLGIDDPKALAFVNHDPDASLITHQLRVGKTVTARTYGDGLLDTLYFPINGRDVMLVVERKDGEFTASERTMHLATRIHVNSGEIVSSLFAATDNAGIPDAIAMQLAEIFGSDIDFHRDLRKGDRFSVVFESQTHNGRHVRSGQILAAEFVNNHEVYQAYWFQTEDGKSGHYNSDGRNLRKTFLRSPLEFSRITTGFSNTRLHPVLHVVRAHKGVDYGAPTGTRIRAVADGVVEFAGWQGGYGNMVVLKHQGRYSTAYGHMNGFAPGIRKGTRVSQGDTIGFVGQTGLATGPHVHYEFRINGRQVDPMSVSLPDAVPLNSAQLSRFKVASGPARAYLDLARQTRMVASIE